MKNCSLHSDEQARLEALQLLQLLDTPAEERFDRITRIAKRMFGVPTVLITLVDSDRLWFKSIQGLDVHEAPRSQSLCACAITEELPLIVPNTLTDERFANTPLVTNYPNIRFYAGCALHAPSNHRIGTLCLIDTEPREIIDEDIEILQELASLVEQEFKATALSTIDELTNISNRRGFLQLAQQALSHCRREKQNACLLYFDLDDFKQINDNLGHSFGDKVLKAFAQILSQSFRTSDVFARLGGDEFVVLLTNTTPQEMDTVIARLKRNVDDYNLQHDHSIKYSCGSTTYAGEESIEALLHKADQEMYSHKASKHERGAQTDC
ncbi:sensor domain-containing diguanylate cyclase [Pseudoalteromonas sp. YIC-656]|uniref:sensor domain-containing diguanylate cyclase n=1 Tax=Pseudoalteromonas pernae TaxID=3118054 RepID=UPI00324283F5